MPIVRARMAACEFAVPRAVTKSSDLLPIKPDRLAGHQFLCRDDTASIRQGRRVCAAAQAAQQTGSYIAYIRAARLHIRVVHCGKQRFKLLSGLLDSIFTAYCLCFEPFADSCAEILVLQHHFMDFKDLCCLCAGLCTHRFLECVQLPQPFPECLCKALQFLVRCPGCLAGHAGLRRKQRHEFSGSDAARYAVTG